MIRLIQFPRAFGQPNPSPFCTKVEILLKMSDRPYEVVDTPDPRKAPKKKLPMIEDKGRQICDSELIRGYLEKDYGVDFDGGLSPQERATAHAYCRMIEERLYWIVVHSRWIEPENWALLRTTFFASLPPLVRSIVPGLVRRDVQRTLYGQGIGRHSRDEIYAFGRADLQAIAEQLADQPFFMGPEATAADATVYPFVAGILEVPFPGPLKDEALRHPNLAAYAKRLRARFFPDLAPTG